MERHEETAAEGGMGIEGRDGEMQRRVLLGAMGLVGACALGRLAQAGPLNPPAGAVAGTGRTLDEVYNKIPGANGSGDGRIPIAGGGAVSITQPGSYVLTGNISAAAGGISVTASDVTVDLNGFTVTNTSTTSFPLFINASRVTVRNGTVIGGAYGVAAGASLTADVVLEDVVVRNAKLRGISLSVGGLDRVEVRRCTVTGTGSTTTSADASPGLIGILVGANNARVEQCSVNGMVSNGTGTPSFLGIQAGGTGGAFVSRCAVSNATSLAGIGLFMVGVGAYRDNTVINFVTGYSGGTDRGGNV